MTEEQPKTLKDYTPSQTPTRTEPLFTPVAGYGDRKYEVGNTNEPVQDGGTSSMGDEPGGGGGTSFIHPFRLSVGVDGDDLIWSVSSVYSTITDGTNGANMTIVGLDADNVFTGEKWIVVEGTVTNLAVTNLEVVAVDDPDEVGVDDLDPSVQDKIRLLIGKVDVIGGVPVKEQFRFDAARLTYGFLNAKIVRVFESCHVHPDYAPPPP